MIIIAARPQSCTSKGVGHQGIGSFGRNSYVSTQCPGAICPYLCTPGAGARRTLYVMSRIVMYCHGMSCHVMSCRSAFIMDKALSVHLITAFIMDSAVIM